MKCEDYLILIDDLVEGELDKHFTEQVNLHIFACRECAERHAVLREEKEMFSHFLFDVEPPIDFVAKIQSKLITENEEKPKAAVIPKGTFNWASKISNFFRLYPSAAVAGLATLFVVNIALLGLIIDRQKNKSAGKNESSFAKSSTNAAEDDKNNPADLAAFSEKSDNDLPSKDSKLEQRGDLSAFLKPSVNAPQARFERRIKAARNLAVSKKPEVSIKSPFPEEKLQIMKFKRLENETAKQIEKIELLMRTFRNARTLEDGETYDVAYEKQQARKLLEKNVLLRQTAESYRTLNTAELLGRAEPLLVEIANLENTPPAQKVLEIQGRIADKNLIISLQAY